MGLEVLQERFKLLDGWEEILQSSELDQPEGTEFSIEPKVGPTRDIHRVYATFVATSLRIRSLRAYILCRYINPTF